MGRLRKLSVDGVEYLWRFSPGYWLLGEEEVEPGEGRLICLDKFFAFVPGNKQAMLKVVFRTWSDAVIGGPLRMGANVDFRDDTSPALNMHCPGPAAALIRVARQLGWCPEKGQGLSIEKGEELLSRIAASQS